MDGLEDYEDNVLSVYPPSYGSSYVEGVGVIKVMEDGDEATFDVVVPPFDADELNIELELYDEDNNFIGNSDATIDNPPALGLNKIVTFKLTTSDGFETADYAYLEPGPNFNDHILHIIDSLQLINSNYKINSISFNKVTSNDRPNENAINVKDVHSAFNIWAYPLHTYGVYYTLEIDCVVGLVYANKNCQRMFKDFVDVETMNWNNNTDPSEPNYDPLHPSGFQTEDVIDMSYMFAGCTKISSIQGSYFNTTNVKTMAHMFEGCTSISNGMNMGISDFNTHNLQNMEAMFKGCTNLGSINLASWATARVYDMSELFSGCIKLYTIDISDFYMGNVTDKANMFYDLGSLWPSNQATVYCTDDTWTAIATGTGLPSNTIHAQPHTLAK
jgi:surface protein